MSKTETAMGSGASAPSQLIKQLRQLQQQMEQNRNEIEALPPAIAAQVSEALAPLEGLSLDKVEQLAQTQRTALDAMAQEMTTQATQSFSKSTQRLQQTINETARQLASSTSSLEAASTAVATLPEAVQELQEQARAMRPRWWRMPALAVGSALASALLVVALVGLLDSSKLALLNVSDPELRNLLGRATPAEFELIKEIYSRRVP